MTYGLQGDEVTVIARFDTVYIVSDKKGNRFPVHESKLSEDLAPVVIEEKKIEQVKNETILLKPTKKNKPATKQQTLF